MSCPNSVALTGLNILKGCKKRPQRTGIKNTLSYAPCPPSCYNGEYTQCPWFK